MLYYYIRRYDLSDTIGATSYRDDSVLGQNYNVQVQKPLHDRSSDETTHICVFERVPMAGKPMRHIYI